MREKHAPYSPQQRSGSGSKVRYILGVKMHAISMSQALDRAGELLCGKRQHYIVTPNPEIVLHAQKHPRFRLILNQASMSLPDGVGLLWASRSLYGLKRAVSERVTGVDFMQEFLKRLSYSFPGCRILFLGERNAAKRSARKLQRAFPSLVFYHLGAPLFPHASFLIKEIIRPHCIFVGLGAPRQEEWIHEHLTSFPTVKVAMGVGGAFDMIAGRLPRAPVILRRWGLEWLWRLLLEPQRVDRIFRAVVVFPLVLLIHIFSRKSL